MAAILKLGPLKSGCHLFQDIYFLPATLFRILFSSRIILDVLEVIFEIKLQLLTWIRVEQIVRNIKNKDCLLQYVPLPLLFV